MIQINSICINCGSSPGLKPDYMESAKKLGILLANKNIRIIYGGANVGLMGQIANTALDNGGEVIGIIPEKIASKVKHENLTDLITVKTMHERKQMMFDLSDAFIGLPGGFGTLEEMFELLTWSQLGYHTKPCGLLNIAGFFDFLINFIDKAVEQRFIKPEHREMLLKDENPDNLLEKLFNYKPIVVEKWLDMNVQD